MQTYRTNTYSDDYRHVCARDLDNYIAKGELVDYLEGCDDIEKEQIRAELLVPSNRPIDYHLDPRSHNAVANSAIFEALQEKVDKCKLSKVAVTGSYYHLKDTPEALPNPEVLVIKDLNGHPFVYDGGKSVIVEMPTSITDFKDWKNYFIPVEDIENLIPIKHIYVNGTEIKPDKYKQILILTVTTDDINKILSNYESKTEYQQDMINIRTLINNKVDKSEYNTLVNKVTTLENKSEIFPISDYELETILD